MTRSETILTNLLCAVIGFTLLVALLAAATHSEAPAAQAEAPTSAAVAKR